MVYLLCLMTAVFLAHMENHASLCNDHCPAVRLSVANVSFFWETVRSVNFSVLNLHLGQNFKVTELLKKQKMCLVFPQ